jgi:hypothetical protein
VNTLVIPAGAATAPLQMNLLDDAELEPDESITVQIVDSSSAIRKDAQGDPYTIYYPGFDLAERDGQLTWVLTDPSYLPGGQAAATVVIKDNDGAGPSLTASLHDNENLRVVLRGQTGSTLVLQTKIGSEPWTSIRTNLLEAAGSAIAIVPRRLRSHSFYRAVQY